MFPRPSTALPSDTTATVFAFQVYLYAASLSAAMILQGSATPGVYAIARSSLELTFDLAMVSSFPFHSSWHFSAFSLLSMVILPLKILLNNHNIAGDLNQVTMQITDYIKNMIKNKKSLYIFEEMMYNH